VGVRGGPPHLAAEFFNIMAGVKIADIQYKSTTATLTAVQSGEAQLTFAPVTSVSVLVKSDKMRIIAVTSAQTNRARSRFAYDCSLWSSWFR